LLEYQYELTKRSAAFFAEPAWVLLAVTVTMPLSETFPPCLVVKYEMIPERGEDDLNGHFNE
jgi:hypothetical protein